MSACFRSALFVAAIAVAAVPVTAKKTPTVGTREAVLTVDAGIVSEPEVSGLTVTLPAPQVNANWAQPGGSASKAMGHLALPDSLTRGWTVSVGKGSDGTRRLNAAPIVYQGRMFTVDTLGSVRVFDVANGKQVWESRIAVKGESDQSAFGGGVSADDGRVFAVTGYGVAAAFDFATGKELWQVNLNTPLRGAPAVADGRVYAVSGDNQLFALNAENGETAWSIAGTTEAAGRLGAAAPAIALDTIVAGFSSGELQALRAENGRTVWADQLARTGRTTTVASLADIDASPVIDRGRVFAVGNGGRFAAIELATGQRTWERNFAGVSTPWVAGEFVYVVTLEAQVICLTRADGKVVWVTQLDHYSNPKKKTGPMYWYGPVLAGDRLLISGSNKTLMSISPYTGKILSQVKLSAPAYLPPIVAGNAVYLLTDDGKVTQYR